MGHAVEVPTQFGSRYRLEKQLGQGAMATVYLARDSLHQREVAIKVIRPELAPILGPDRFLREIRIASQLTHPHILPLLDSGDVAGRLFYAMPVARGETLRARLDRERQLPLEVAIAIARDVADALQYAHAHGIVHRDIKPENILLEGERALVADFGIARVVDPLVDGGLSSSGIAVGTPAYMSPEQASADRMVDGRSDLYSLGCVFYEMLVGERLFSGPSAQIVAKRHMHEKVPSVALARPDLPRWVQVVVEKALAKTPADRYATAGELIRALEERRPAAAAPPTRWLNWRVLLFVVGMTITGAYATSQRIRAGLRGGPDSTLDSTRYALLSATPGSVAPAGLKVEELLHRGFARWTGIQLVHPFQVEEAVRRRGGGAPATVATARNLARALGAGRYVRAAASVVGNEIRVDAALYETVSGSTIRQASVTGSIAPSSRDSAVTELANRLLFGSVTESGGWPQHDAGTNSAPALQSYFRGQAALAAWNLAEADSAFAFALESDAKYANAALWLALVRLWDRSPSDRWRSLAQLAKSNGARLGPDDRILADATLAYGNGKTGEACSLWHQVTRQQPANFAGWYCLATCLAQDSVVIPDNATRSGWRFRSSYGAALEAYRRAFELLPPIRTSFKRASYGTLRRLVRTDRTDLREGWGPAPDSHRFAAFPSWEGDSLAFVPFPASEVMAGRLTAPIASIKEAEVHQRQLFHRIATSWVAAYPSSADALEALAISLELLSDPSALDTLRRARAMSKDAAERTLAATAEVWLRLKLSIPDDTGGIASARLLADSLLSPDVARSTRDPALLASLAAVTGRANLAAELSARSAPARLGSLPGHLSKAGLALLAFASMGGPHDSLDILERQVTMAIDKTIPLAWREASRMDLLARSATLTFPEYRFRSFVELGGHGDPLLDAQIRASQGDVHSVELALSKLKRQREVVEPSSLMIDALYAESKLFMVIGDLQGAAVWLDRGLKALHQTPPGALSLEATPGILVRAMVLRAQLAHRLRDHSEARRWAVAVLALWSNPDQFLMSTEREMKWLRDRTS